ncbi:diguanylate cyclase [Gemmatirosa kalamazoonensis]|uniref:Diguanylate cyclase n=1 Tax=Gemmatirosa kalamazoonensis TaxID=861299 RepID=W0RAN1_9BACT|nr:EAL domain-containing protein [Gemmatirosa kalamazoonensis]AHG87841.1 diguanylate cyclase [Gemmatirosa kalamazoonensis]
MPAPSDVPATRHAPVRDRLGAAFQAVVVATAAAALLLWGWRFAPGGDAAAKAQLCANALVPLGVGLVVVLWLAPRRADVDRRARRAWRDLAAAVTVWWLAGVLWELLGRPPLSAADGVQLLFFPLVLLGVLRFPAAPLEREERLRVWLDTAMVLSSGAAVVWYLALWPAIARGDDLAQLVVNTLYPLGDVVLLFAAYVALRRGGGATRGAVRWAAAGLLSRFAGDLLYLRQSFTGAYDPGGLSDLMWLLGCLMLAAGACAQRRASEPAAEERTAPQTRASLLPYVSAVLLLVFFAVAVGGAWTPRTLVLLAATIVVTSLVFVRQYMVGREHVRLQGARVRLEAERAGEARFRTLVQNSSDLILIVDGRGIVRFASPSLERMLGVRPEDAEGQPLVTFVHPDDAADAAEALAVTRSEHRTFGPSQYRVSGDGATWRAVECMAENLYDDPAVRGVLITVRDVTERARLEAQLIHQAFHDPLTGLANRALFRDRVEHALAREGRDPHGVVALFLDLDDFKTVNDSLGHREGDRLLAVVADRLLNATRGCDTVARLGGDEFGVLLENAHADADAVIVAERIVNSVRVPITLAGQDVSVGASVGIARARSTDGAEELLRNADVAMYRAKQRGKSTYEIFAPAMHAAVVDRMELEGDLRRAVADDCAEMRVHYQPIVELADGKVAGLEALVRWQHPRRGLVQPTVFIPAAESTGLIVPLGRWVLREACAQAARWQAARHAADPLAPPLTITVNLSARQLQDPSLADDVRAALDDAGLPPHALVLEITESVIIAEPSAALATLAAVKALGVRLAIDDFGTGYSSLGYLQQFPVDVLKIDKAFVDGVTRGGPRAALTRTIVALGDSLALHCVAEGIEDELQRRHLQALGCGYGQGFLFARPLPADEIEAMICDGVAA